MNAHAFHLGLCLLSIFALHFLLKFNLLLDIFFGHQLFLLLLALF